MVELDERLNRRKFIIPKVIFKQNWETEQYVSSKEKLRGAMSGIIQTDLLGEKLLGETNRGDVFLYLFRRFGYSGFGSDDYKHLIKYILTTPMKNVVLIVNPAEETWGHFGYLITKEHNQKLENTRYKANSRWEKRMKKWAKENHKEEFVIAIECYHDKKNQEKAGILWKKWIKKEYPTLSKKEEKEIPKEQIEKISTEFWDNQDKLWKKYIKLYNKIEKHPDEKQFENNPLKKRIDKALLETMYDLKKVVYIRDIPYNIHGRLTDEEAEKFPKVEKSSMAGYGVFIEAYKDYDYFIKFMDWITKKGKGNLFKGIDKLKKGD